MPPLSLAPGLLIPIESHQNTIAAIPKSVSAFPTVLIAAAPTEAWRILTDVLLPVWAGTIDYPVRSLIQVLLLANQVWLMEYLRPLAGYKVFFRNASECFSDATFPRASASLPLLSRPQSGFAEVNALADQLLWAIGLNPAATRAFGALYRNTTARPGHVLLDRETERFRVRLQKLFRNCTFRKWPKSDNFWKIVQKVAECQIVFVGHISSTAFGLFLSHNATMLELQPEGLECTAFGERFAELAGAHYRPVRSAPRCDCQFTNLTCYLEHKRKYPPVSDAELKVSLELAFAEAMS
jgi:hypothetical protein